MAISSQIAFNRSLSDKRLENMQMARAENYVKH